MSTDACETIFEKLVRAKFPEKSLYDYGFEFVLASSLE